MSQSNFTYTVPGRVQQDTKAYIRYLDIPVCRDLPENIAPPGWFVCEFLDNSQGEGGDIGVDPNVGEQEVNPKICLPQFFNCYKCAADKEYFQLFKIGQDFVDFQFRIPGNWKKGFAINTSTAGSYDFEMTVWSCASDGSGMFVPSPTATYKLPVGRFGADFIQGFTGITKEGVEFQNIRVNKQSFITHSCNTGRAYANNTGFLTLDVYPNDGGDPYTIYSQMFDFQCAPCESPILKIRGTYPTVDFWGNIYTLPVSSIGTAFVFDNTCFWPGEIFHNGIVENRTLDDNQQTLSVRRDDNYRCRIDGIPPYENEFLKINTGGIDTFINDLPYNAVSGYDKNNERGDTWFPEFTAKRNFGYGINNPVTNCP